jgi:tetratricopeptide (TPR) repeat protein
MFKIAKIALGVVCTMTFLTRCNDNTTSSPYDNVLKNPPFDLLSDSIRKNPETDSLYFRRAVLLNKNNYPEPALADFRTAWSLHKDERYAFGISTILLDKNADSAILFLRDAITELPQSILLRINLAHAYDDRGRLDDALNVCNDILRLAPGQVDVLKLKAELLDKKGNPSEALVNYERAYALTPFDIDLNYTLAFRYAQEKNPKVLSLCDSLAKKDSLGKHAEPYYFKGLYYSNTNNSTKAIALFDEAIRHDYTFKNAYIEKGRILLDQGKPLDAYKIFNLVMTISPQFADAYYWMGQCQEAMGQKAEAKLNYQRAFSLDKTFTEAKDAADRL